MTDPFIVPVPLKLANDPELAPFFNYLHKVLHDLTAVKGNAIETPSADVDSLKTAVDAIREQMQVDGTIAS